VDQSSPKFFVGCYSIRPLTTQNFVTSQGRFVTRRLGLAMVNRYIKYEVSMFTHYEDMKGDEKCKNWGGLGG